MGEPLEKELEEDSQNRPGLDAPLTLYEHGNLKQPTLLYLNSPYYT